MFANYLKIALRNILSNKGFSVINIAGLSIGMTCCLIIFQYVVFESSFDNFHEKGPHIYRVLQAWAKGNEDLGTGHGYTAQALAPALSSEVQGLSYVSRVASEQAIVSSSLDPGKVLEENDILYVDPEFIKMFSFKLLHGNHDKVLEPGNVIISESVAQKYFGTTNPIGQTLHIVGSIEKSFNVSGVCQNVPLNSHLQFTMLLPIQDLLSGPDYSQEPENGWSWNNFTTYVELLPARDPVSTERMMTDVYLKYRGDIIKQQGGRASLRIQPLSDIHLNSEIESAGSVVSGSYKTLYFFVVIGLITLVIALVNYINLATARAMNRSREVGVRKVVGANRGQLIVQFLYESALTNLSAVLIALATTAALLPVVNRIAETKLEIAQWNDPKFIFALSLTTLAATLLAGVYPAFVLSSFRPAAVLKGRTASMASHLWLRRGLVIVQFASCIVLITGTIVVYEQLKFMRSMDLGLNLDQVVAIAGPRVLSKGADRPTLMRTFVNEVNNISGISGAAMSSSIPGRGFNWNGASFRKSTDDPANALRGVATYIDSSFAKLYGLQLVAGKGFDNYATTDQKDAPWLITLNETAVKNLGYPSASYAIGESLDIGGKAATVIGVFKDFRWSSAHESQQNIVFGRTSSGYHISVKMAGKDFPAMIKQIESFYSELFPGNIFSYRFVDQVFDMQYRNEKRFANLFSVFAGMTILIACLGLFGLVAFTAQQRTKEIGMRKVLGANVTNIVALLSKDFLKLVLIGFLIAVPITIYVMNKWLTNFADRIQIGVGIFITSGIVAFVVAVSTVSWQSLRAARANPVKSLRSE